MERYDSFGVELRFEFQIVSKKQLISDKTQEPIESNDALLSLFANCFRNYPRLSITLRNVIDKTSSSKETLRI